jgi:hypothetical protein
LFSLRISSQSAVCFSALVRAVLALQQISILSVARGVDDADECEAMSHETTEYATAELPALKNLDVTHTLCFPYSNLTSLSPKGPSHTSSRGALGDSCLQLSCLLRQAFVRLQRDCNVSCHQSDRNVKFKVSPQHPMPVLEHRPLDSTTQRHTTLIIRQLIIWEALVLSPP